MGVRSTLRRYHIWLGWMVGVPVVFWTVSGLVMVARPIEDVRGTKLIRAPEPMTGAAVVRAPHMSGVKVQSLKLESRAEGPRWVLVLADGTTRLADPRTGALLPALSAADAAREVSTRYTGTATVVSTSKVDSKSPPLEFRSEMPAWVVNMSDDTHFYVDAGSGDIVARRTAWWRVYDFFWGLHIMDLQGREDTNNPWIISFGGLSVLMAFLAMILLPMASKTKRRKPKP